MGELIQFVPRPNPKADRAFWIGREPDPMVAMAFEIMNQVDTAPCEMGFVADERDPA